MSEKLDARLSHILFKISEFWRKSFIELQRTMRLIKLCVCLQKSKVIMLLLLYKVTALHMMYSKVTIVKVKGDNTNTNTNM